MNVKRILCPVDFSRFSDAALQFASTLAAESNAALYIVYVEEGSPSYVPGYAGGGFVPDPMEARERSHRVRLGKTEPTVPNVDFSHHILSGQPDKKILEFADLENIDLIVMGTHGWTGVARVLMGSTAESIVRHASCPVLTVKQPVDSQSEKLATSSSGP